jgi:hypothetical protein
MSEALNAFSMYTPRSASSGLSRREKDLGSSGNAACEASESFSRK